MTEYQMHGIGTHVIDQQGNEKANFHASISMTLAS
jgi:hypothetical protein